MVFPWTGGEAGCARDVLSANLQSMTDYEWERLSSRLAQSAFRSRFRLSEKDKSYVREKGRDTIRAHAYELIGKRLRPLDIPNDGKQTPMRGHPVFIAQHATACCCRGCLEKWHHISKGHELSDKETDYVVEVLMRWIDHQMSI